jgi:thiol:disulfide interchange protein DsbD
MAGCSAPPEQAGSISWQKYEPVLLLQAKERQRPVMINFHADWCAPCLELEKYTFSDGSVVQASAQFLPLVVDWTDFESMEAELPGGAGTLQKEFGVLGLPAILFLDIRGEEIREARVSGYLDPEELVEQMKQALGSS